ncbi:hypothetical protein [Pandoraea faecigallinarum]|uniref:Uncharacterized protein n=1 Tax=Pandoraea faecigallinarum TaxID=656179 RepID=A0A0H3WZ72_9BURK|nr:hypothetical protein [Pandoraea faecigallinarum]
MQAFEGARVLRAVAEPRAGTQCTTVLPRTSPVEVQVEGRTVMNLPTGLDRVTFLTENRASAVWMEAQGATRPLNGCPADVRPGQVAADIADRMSCLGLGVDAGSRTAVGPETQTGASSGASSDARSEARARTASAPGGASEFATMEALSLPSVYIREPGFEPGTVAALEYDLGWRALAPSWRTVMPSIDEAAWAADPNTALFRAVGRAVLPHLATYEHGDLADEICARIVSFHMHAGGWVDCLSNVTQTAARPSPNGESETVAAIELSDFLRECAGTNWRESLIGREGEDALTRRREACSPASTTAATSVGAAETR